MTKRQRQASRRYAWADLPEQELLALRFSDLELTIEGSELAQRVQRLYDDLSRRNLQFRPHVWLAEEWFTPDGIPGIAVPFYLAHPRLVRLERKFMLEAEGAGERACMRILRHEAGHAIDNAYRLHFKRSWTRIFGRYSQAYPDFYQPKPYSRSYVLHLDMWYAQAHPAEDFAETFAVWLTPGSRWRKQYHGWPALRKLEYVDALMNEIADQPQPVRSRRQIDPLSRVRTTLRQHYHQKIMHYGQEWPDFYDRDLRRLFSDDARFKGNPTAARFLYEVRPWVRQMASKWTGTYQYTIDQVLLDMIDRCRELKLRLAVPPRRARTEALALVIVQTMNYLHEGHHRVAL